MTKDLGDRPWYGDWPEKAPKMIEIPEVSLGDLLRETTKEYPDRRAIVFLDSVLTYRQLDDYVDRFASSLHNLGLKKGDVLAVMLPNSHQFVITFFACQRLGIVATAINPTYKSLEIKHQLNDSGAKAFVCLDAVFQEAEKIIYQTKVKHVIGTNIVDACNFSFAKVFLGKLLKKIPVGNMPNDSLKFKDLLKTEINLPKITLDPVNDLAVLQYTGGTTGTPKGAMLTARNLVANALQLKSWLSSEGAEERFSNMGFVGILPLFHVFAMTCCMTLAIVSGSFQLLFPKPPDSMHDWAVQIEKWGKGYKLVMAGVAVLYNKINNTSGLKKYDLSPLSRGLSGAGPLPREIQLEFEKKFNCQIVEGYGLSESSPVSHANPFDIPDGSERVMGSIGLPISNTDCKVVDMETGEKRMPLGDSGVGELCIKGPQVMKGYFNRLEESKSALRDGWLYTGDIAYMDERGWTFIKDRAKDLVKHKGFSVFPKEVEDYMFSHPQILEVAVIGIPHPKVGEVLKAFVVPRPEFKDSISAEEVINWCKENMTHYKVPSIVEFREDLPKTMVGKILRRVLKEEEKKKRMNS